MDERKGHFEEGEKLRAEANARQQRIEEIKLRKLKELQVSAWVGQCMGWVGQCMGWVGQCMGGWVSAY